MIGNQSGQRKAVGLKLICYLRKQKSFSLFNNGCRNIHGMKHWLLIALVLPAGCSPAADDSDIKRYKEQAARVNIVRDKWGVPHIYGKSDADAVFGLMYAQCEESFEWVEKNYIEKLGRLAEVEGESYLYSDLLMQLIYDTSAAKADYQASPPWLKRLLHAFADGINYYLYKNPRTRPALLKRFEPWFPLLFTDGGYTAMQTAGLTIDDIKSMYFLEGAPPSSLRNSLLPKAEPTGSNAFAIGPSKTKSKNALLYINPHVSFYFRTEMHMISEEGLNAYGAITWGQFFVFQGFNENCGWMHTSSLADAADLYQEDVIRRNDSIFYKYEGSLKKMTQRQLNLKYKKNNVIQSRKLISNYTHHGPVVGIRNEKWLSLQEKNRSLNGLMQSWMRTKANSFDQFHAAMELKSNSSTNTLYADSKGNIAYWHGNFIPVRDPMYDWTLPVDGNISATEWKGTHELSDIVNTHNPKQGWIQNCNSSPFSMSGYHSMDEKKYPAYMAPDGDNFRSVLAIKEIEKENNFDLDKLIELGYNNYLALFDTLLPPLLFAYDQLPASSPYIVSLKEVVDTLRYWNKRSSVGSVATTVATEWANYLIGRSTQTSELKMSSQLEQISAYSRNTLPHRQLEMLAELTEGLKNTFGTWKVRWGDVNRYQRVEKAYEFDDTKPSIGVGLASAYFGSLPAYETTWGKGNKAYGIAGNSFVAAVEFGEKLRAKSIITGGQSFDPSSKHFADQAAMFVEGKFKDVLFYREDVLNNAERTYHPGD